jgi:ParB family chromosome partitioning protein
MTTNALVFYDAAKQAVAKAASVDEVKSIKDKAEAIRLYAQQQKDDDLERYAALIKTRAMRRLGELSAELDKAKPGPKDTSQHREVISKADILANAGVSTSTAHRCEKLASMPEKKFEAALSDGVTATEMLKGMNVHVSNNAGENEWYTPPEYVEAAIKVLGIIDLDPASSTIANKIIKAKKFYTNEDDGLQQKWEGNIFLNPPYSQPEIKLFSEKVSDEYEKGEISQAIILVNNATETAWFQRILSVSSAVCFVKSRIRFLDPEGNPKGAPLQGQAILYFGEKDSLFRNCFSQFGVICRAF